ncbi:PepSY domain-containing protein [Paenibacillus piscarius]|uniref:PepSY domain-containing protein n=1 Tax=Paenibacillus piscarius TaxID=1089681 RepID=UPI001EE9414F|nr:PepSY domain-containing protein [Paenibacillus piscarius]
MTKERISKKWMNRSSLYKAGLITAACLLLVLAVLWWLERKEPGPLLTREQATLAVMDEYPGKLENLRLQSGNYTGELLTAQGRYELKLDGVSGEIISIVLLKRTDEPVVQPTAAASPVPSGGAAATPSPAPSPTAVGVVSEKEAVRLALKEVPGEVDDVDTEIDDSGAFYLVEIHTPDGREAVVQVNAVSGSIMSVTWEEPEEDDS